MSRSKWVREGPHDYPATPISANSLGSRKIYIVGKYMEYIIYVYIIIKITIIIIDIIYVRFYHR